MGSLPTKSPSSAGSKVSPGVDGSFGLAELRYRKAFNKQVVDQGLLRYMLREVLVPTALQIEASGEDRYIRVGSSRKTPMITLGDLGGSLGGYSQWLNDTGLVEAFAFDGSDGIEDITDGRVTFTNLALPKLDLGRQFDWILCVEVAEHVPQAHEKALVDNIARHSLYGAVISWHPRRRLREDEALGIFELPFERSASSPHLNERDDDEVRQIMAQVGLDRDDELTLGMRDASTVDYIKLSVAVYRKRKGRHANDEASH
eukprot:gnl/TRDRNA2_/TRDRNA2_150183_c0_seq1.p1 gnl/TRDRNA2_/TRDRNA2_150183_c0~~gnl/TRDRNA2_/TRDRNA2_150183_c0_seq1.p1  ORF type:complete len:259 (+),score=43.66 gnl/TRDRNA2_/TRDRNA2_150183_c0_seq1:57-833(+)